MTSQSADDSAERQFDMPSTPLKFKLPDKPSRASLSLFDLALEVVPSKTQKTEYEDELHKETIDWNHLLKEKMQEIVRARDEQVVVDKSILSEEQLSYLERAKQIDEFVDGSEPFLHKAREFLEKYNQIVEMQEDLLELATEPENAATFDLVLHCRYGKRATGNTDASAT